jgi:hypothetical protein
LLSATNASSSATLQREKLGTMLNLLDAQENLQQQRTPLAQHKGQLAEAVAAIAVIERDAAKAVDAFIADVPPLKHRSAC